jgi:RNA polymerase sigma-70 factor (ECF subfamily)
VSAEDADTVAAVRAGDVAAFETLYRRYYAPMVAFATPFVRDPDVARELVSDVFLMLWERRTAWDVRTSVATYLYQSLRHRAANYRRDAAVDRRHITLASAEGMSIGSAAPAAAVDEALVQQERIDQLWRAVDALPEPRRTALRLRWRDQMSFDEIADVLGTSSAAVQMQISRALKMLRETLRDA